MERSGDEWYDQLVNGARRSVARRRNQGEADAREKLEQAGAEHVDDYDLAAMNDQLPLVKGAVQNRFAKQGRRIIGRWDAKDAEPVSDDALLAALPGGLTEEGLARARSRAVPVPPEEREKPFYPTRTAELYAEGVQKATGAFLAGLEEEAKAIGTGVYEAGRGAWELGADVNYWLSGEDDAYRPPAAHEVGIPKPVHPFGEAAAGIVKYGVAFASAFGRLRGLAAQPVSRAGQIFQTSQRAVVAGGITDLLQDPRTESVFSMIRSVMALENEILRDIDPSYIYSEAETGAGYMRARAAMAGEGLVIGGVFGGAMSAAVESRRALGGAAAAIYAKADALERVAVEGLSKTSVRPSTLYSVGGAVAAGAEDIAYATAFLAAKVLKGARKLTAEHHEILADSGLTKDQITQAWNDAGRLHNAAAEDILAERAARPEFVQALERQAARFETPTVAGRELEPELAGRVANNFFHGIDPQARTKAAIAERMQSQVQETGELLEAVPENLSKFEDMIAADIKTAIGRSGSESGGKWYREHVERTHQLVGLKHPEILEDPDAKSAFNFALAITSQGVPVKQNGRIAIAVYEQFKEAGGRFPEKLPKGLGAGKAQPVMEDAFKTFNAMVDEHGVDQIRTLMNAEFTVRELEAAGFSVSGENKDVVLNGSAVFGPKIGGGFFQNLEGNLKPLTMDMWWRRTWGRYTGRILEPPEKQDVYIKQFAEAIDRKGQKYWGIPSKTAFRKLPREEKIKVMRSVYSKFSRGFKEKDDPLATTSRAFEKAYQPIETMSGGERQYMRDAVDGALLKLRSEGIEVERADAQAILWYLEKEIYRHQGQRGVNLIAFDDPLMEWAREEGYGGNAIGNALGAVRERVAGPTGSGAVGGGETRGGAQAAGATEEQKQDFLRRAAELRTVEGE